MKKIWGILIILVIFASWAASPQKSTGNANEIFSKNGFITFQNAEYVITGALVNDLQKTMEIWNTPDSQGLPKLSTIIEIKRNEPISVFLTYSTNKNNLNMTYDFKTQRPDGTFSKTAVNGLEIAKGNIPNNLLYRAKQIVTMAFDETDNLGTYQFHITIYADNKIMNKFIMEFDLIE